MSIILLRLAYFLCLSSMIMVPGPGDSGLEFGIWNGRLAPSDTLTLRNAADFTAIYLNAAT